MVNAPLFVHHVIFPVFMFYSFPPLLGFASLANLLIDMLVFILAIKFFSIPVAWRQGLNMFISLWLIGLVADVAGSLFLTFTGAISLKMKTNLVNYFSIYASPTSILFFILAVVLSGFIIYWLDRLYLSGPLSKKQAARVALVFAFLTAPYTFLIPTSWIY
ncbi:hypothetical protein ACFP7A_05885 [Sporolactobacillus kofuensis]|uniref:Rod shape-determining protein MreD n=1 Tax=Sporolactobacillus kofuensis TaxID=269672 RepID=A0ABW1WC30_9BACL|nr:hypothetical protein [Sporolactobacillus kofuensis]MCO7175122.1 hypothetical protein [Sporolactobacillus kofuensis]